MRSPYIRNSSTYHYWAGGGRSASQKSGDDNCLNVLWPWSSKSQWSLFNQGNWTLTHNAIVKCSNICTTSEPIYRGRLPISSLKEVETRGKVPSPKAKTDSPIVAWNSVQFKSFIMEGMPMLYVEVLDPTITMITRILALWAMRLSTHLQALQNRTQPMW